MSRCVFSFPVTFSCICFLPLHVKNSSIWTNLNKKEFLEFLSKFFIIFLKGNLSQFTIFKKAKPNKKTKAPKLSRTNILIYTTQTIGIKFLLSSLMIKQTFQPEFIFLSLWGILMLSTMQFPTGTEIPIK